MLNLVFIICLTIFSLTALGGPPPSSNNGNSEKSSNEELNISESLKTYDGKIVRHLVLSGRRWSNERALLWLINTHEGSVFNFDTLESDIHALYNTTDLYEISAQVIPSTEFVNEITLVISFEEKWTLLPFFSTQGGGGNLTFGGGLFDSNLGGYFVNGYFGIYNNNGKSFYDIDFNQEYIAGTPWMGSLEVSTPIISASIHKIDNSSAGTFSWQRQQTEIMAGYHFNGPIRLLIFTDEYQDAILDSSGVNVSSYNNLQYKIHPQIIFGRANIVEYYEEGYEFTLHPQFANFFETARNYTSLLASYKNVTQLPHRAGLAFFLSANVSSPTPVVYEPQVGGFSSVRGFSDNRQVGPRAASFNIEYRPYLFNLHFPLIEKVVFQGCLFSDLGSAWGDNTLTGESNLNTPNILWSGGFGLRLNFLHFAGAIVRFDMARTIRPDEGLGFSFGVGQFF
jgi:hypothetical protein